MIAERISNLFILGVSLIACSSSSDPNSDIAANGSGGFGASSSTGGATNGSGATSGAAGTGTAGTNSGTGGAAGSAGTAGMSGAAGAAPADCSAIAAQSDWDLCASGPGTCEAVFNNSAGCPAVCATVGMICTATYENVEGTCSADLAQPELPCESPSPHQSDYCICTLDPNCTPNCDGKECGSDGCGGVCGSCDAGESCVNGVCSGVQEDCSSYPFKASTLLSERAGFGANASGGNPSQVYHVTTLAGDGTGSLRQALESSEPYWIVFDVNGKITLQDKVEVRSNKTIDGRGRNIVVEGTLALKDAQNVIISDIAVTNELEGHCTQAGDVIRLEGTGGDSPESYSSRDIWIHHVEAFNGGDGLIDIRGASNITISWSHLHTHKKAMLCSNTIDQKPSTGMRVTFHHNFFDRLTLRGPQFLYGWAHYFNNYQLEWYEYGAAALQDSQFYSENNVYEARPGEVCIPACPDPNPCGDNDFFVSKKALVTYWTEGNGNGKARSVGDWALNGAIIEENEPENVFDPSAHYSYLAEPASDSLKTTIAAEAGPRVNYCK